MTIRSVSLRRMYKSHPATCSSLQVIISTQTNQWTTIHAVLSVYKCLVVFGVVGGGSSEGCRHLYMGGTACVCQVTSNHLPPYIGVYSPPYPSINHQTPIYAQYTVYGCLLVCLGAYVDLQWAKMTANGHMRPPLMTPKWPQNDPKMTPKMILWLRV